MPLPDLLPIQPFTRSVRGDVTLPGSKSLTNRALLLAALCDQPVQLTGALFSEDTELMANALRTLGLTIVTDEGAKTIQVSQQPNAFRNNSPVELFVGLAGTAARFLTALCAAAPCGVYRLDGVPQMRKRPMKGLIDALRALGADVRCTAVEGFFPLEIHARGLRGGAVSIDATESSQLLSALLMVAPLAHAPVEVTLIGGVRWPFVQMTARLMQNFGQPPFSSVDPNSGERQVGRGVPAEPRLTQRVRPTDEQSLTSAKSQAAPVTRSNDGRFVVSNATRYVVPSGRYAIEPDATAASYFLALPLVAGGDLQLSGLRGPGGGLQGDTHFASVMSRVGLSVSEADGGLIVSFSREGARQGVEQNFSEFSDTFLTLAAIAPLLKGRTVITGIAHTRKQETDRVAGMARELTRLGQHVIESEDSLEIHPRPLRAGETIETYGDHRFAMSFGILGCHDLQENGLPWLTIRNPACCAKTFPHFFELLESLRQKSLGI